MAAPLDSTLTLSDHAFLHALSGWGKGVDPRFWGPFRPAWGVPLRAAREALPGGDPRPAIEQLRREHAAEARPDLARIHPSWLARALQEEPPSVRRAVLANVASPLREALANALGLGPEDLKADRPPRPEALQAVLALWTERLVGDLPERPDDPLAIRALTRLGPRELVRLARSTGLAKWAIASDDASAPTAGARVRLAFFARAFRPIDKKARALAQRDTIAASAGNGDARHGLTRLGWTTVARLLALADPFRTRWALQHLPYPVAKFTRALVPTSSPSPGWLRWEEAALRAAWSRLHDEGRLPDAGDGGGTA